MPAIYFAAHHSGGCSGFQCALAPEGKVLDALLKMLATPPENAGAELRDLGSLNLFA
jgi:hypothetical protein